MQAPQTPRNEDLRLKEVKSYKLLDTLPEEAYDNITSLIAEVCEAPISLITLLDEERNFLKSHHGVPFNESPRNISFCGHAILEEDSVFIIEDATADERFNDNPLVSEHEAKFYAGAPLVSPSGHKLGTLCVFDTKPRSLSQSQKNVMIKMAQQVVKLFELHKKNIELIQIDKELKERNERLKSFAGIVSHDLKSPLANITSLTDLLKLEYEDVLKGDGLTYLQYIKESSDSLRNYIDGMLQYYKAEGLSTQNSQTFNIQDLYSEIEDMNNQEQKILQFSKENNDITTNKVALQQILMNLVDNGFKYNLNSNPKVEVQHKVYPTYYEFSVTDNGQGISESDKETIFDLFKTGESKDKDGKKGTGVGLASVKALVEKLEGTINVSSTLGEGSQFIFTIKK